MDRKVLLMILDGWGEGKHDHSNAIYTQGAPFIDTLRAKYPMSHLQACGEYVGLPDGQMGNSEVGHMNLGAGRVVYQDLMKINKACREHKLLDRAEVKGVYDYVKQSGKKLHLLGLCSRGGVHSSLEHYFEFLNVAKEYGLEDVYVHCFMDGRDTDPRSGAGFVAELEEHMAASTGKVASVCGRFYAMDRDKRWERIQQAYNLLVKGEGAAFTSAAEGIKASYEADVTDEFIKPIVITGADGQPLAKIEEGDAVIFMNFRNDRAREITAVLTQNDMPDFGMKVIPNLYYCCMTPYDASFTGLHILFDKELVQDTLGEVVSKAGKRQLRIAETEKYAHVTFFFNGGVEAPNPGEDRCLIPSPKVATYDLQPEMSAYEVTEEAVKRIDSGKYDVMILNFANPDMVGHTGVMEAAVKAVHTVDECAAKVVEAILRNGGRAIITADHGNCERMLADDGITPFTAHTTNPVPVILVDNGRKDAKLRSGGRLSDLAPTMLDLMGMEIPREMTGKSLIEK